MPEHSPNPKKENTAGRVRTLITPIAASLGLSIWDVEFSKRGRDSYLTVTIDKPDGVTIDDCEALHRAIDAPLDEADIIDVSYMLEVSSPGIERTLNLPEHFAWALGSQVEIRTFSPVGGSRVLRGKLLKADGGVIVLEASGAETSVNAENVSRATTVFDFGTI